MFCSRCGAENPENSFQCVRCQQAIVRPDPGAAGVDPAAAYPQSGAGYPSAPPPGYGPPPGAYGYPQSGPQAGYPTQSIPNYLVQAILVTLFCCLPAGIAAIVYANQVNTKLAMGDFAGAMQASKNASLWSWISFGLGASVGLLYFLAVGAAVVSGGH